MCTGSGADIVVVLGAAGAEFAAEPVAASRRRAVTAADQAGLPPDRGGPGRKLSFLAEGGRMGELIIAHDWAATPIGAIEEWPHSLRTAVRSA